ncbi:NAD(P)/FAD-dependent oxidoreductase [Oceanobacter sp. 3_MG-2023]|uniref:NAD(P)/FAD-dependent oxidoreductase n=1 Tax=Oceanobacter sp. 3_MG-2023 TaxID=3062622 RepID=UPI002733300C|nr:FAD-dependent oxidoreductase [Oceanobacter sp. 3_MG-2023]MDP2505165.1 FAD-dependent oxidoreductase [Oceanobacter sp. 3_MG-2023]
MNSNSLVIIGNGMAANRVLEELGTDHPFDTIHVLSDEHLCHYNRIMLSPLLANETTLAAITPHDASWYQQRRIHVHLNTAVTGIDTELQQVVTATGQHFDYQALLIATGSRSAIPSMPGTDGDQPDNVLGFRTMTDVDAMLAALPTLKHATVIGAGLLGVEAAVGLKAQGVEVTLMHRNPVLMNRQLDATAATILQEELTQRGIDVRTGVSPQSLSLNANRATAVHYRLRNQPDTDTTTIRLDTDLVVFATGILPNRELAAAAGITTRRGICVNSHMQTSDSHIYALGECCEFEGQTYGLVAPIWEQAKIVAAGLAAIPPLASPLPRYAEQQHLTKLKVSGVDIHSMGQFEATGHDQVIQLQDLTSGVYKKLVIQQQRIVGVLCVGDVLDSNWYFDLLSQQVDIRAIRANLILGKGYCDNNAAGLQHRVDA